MHISMCIKKALSKDSTEPGDHFLMLLNEHMNVCAEHAATSRNVRAVCKAMPGRSLRRRCLPVVTLHLPC